MLKELHFYAPLFFHEKDNICIITYFIEAQARPNCYSGYCKISFLVMEKKPLGSSRWGLN